MISIISLLSNAVAKGIAIIVLVGFLRTSQSLKLSPLLWFGPPGYSKAISFGGSGATSLPRGYFAMAKKSRVYYSPLITNTNGDSPSSSSSEGTILARVLPRDRIGYELRKPKSRNLDVDLWRKRVIKPSTTTSTTTTTTTEHDSLDVHLPLPLLHGNDTITEWAVSLDVKLNSTLLLHELDQDSGTTTTTEHPIQVHFNMHRQAAETMERTLKRLFLSTRRKIVDAQISVIKSNKKGKKIVGHMPSLHLQDRSSASSSDDNREQCSSRDVLDETSIWVPVAEQTKSSVARRYRQLKMDPKSKNYEFWTNLAEYPSQSIIRLNLQTEETQQDVVPLIFAGSIPLQVESCPPTILSVQTFEEFQANVFVGVLLCIEVEVLHAERARIIWFVNGRQVLYDSQVYTPVSADVGQQISVLISPIRSSGSKADADGGGYDEVYFFESKVQERPFLPIVHARASWLQDNPKWEQSRPSIGTGPNGSSSSISSSSNASSPRLRVMTYNLLADLYASRKFDEDHHVTYKHCDNAFLSKRHRFPLLVYEILQYQPDIVCLQEVDATIFDQLLRPVLQSQGYRGFYSNKVGANLEGCATFWSLQCFEEEAIQQEFPLRELLTNSQYQTTRGPIQLLLDHHPMLQSVLGDKVGQILQVVTLRLKKDCYSRSQQRAVADTIVVGNTHLFYHPMADHIRAIQAYTVCQQLDKIRHQSDRTAAQDPPSPFILCGDLNSDPLSGAMRLLLHRQVEADHFETWKHLHSYTWNMGEQEYMVDHGYVGRDVNASSDPTFMDEAFEDAQQEPHDKIESSSNTMGLAAPPCIQLPESIPKLILGYREIPEFTNFATDFCETLDYILASGPNDEQPIGFEALDEAAPCPTSLEMKDYVAMPNEFMPSDHVSLVCDLQWKRI